MTLDDLVKELGLSRGAISQIINGKGRFAAATRERVLTRARELSYSPHGGARAARLQRFETIALFNAAPFWQGLVHPGIYEACMEACAGAGYRLLLETVTSAGMPGLAQRSNLLGQRVCDGLLMNYHLPPTAELRRLVDACGVPVVWLNLNLGNAACVIPDDDGAARHLVRALIARGRRRIAYVDCGMHDYRSSDGLAGAHASVATRWRAVQDEMRTTRLPLLSLTPGPMPYAQRLVLAREMLASPGRPDAVVCYNQLDSQLILTVAAELGLIAGRDLGVVQFSEHAEVAQRPVSTAVIPFPALARAAVAMLLATIDGTPLIAKPIVIPYTYDLEATL